MKGLENQDKLFWFDTIEKEEPVEGCKGRVT